MKCLNTGVISYVGGVWSSAGELSPEYDCCWQWLTSFDNLCSSLLESQNFLYLCRPLGWGPKRLDWNRKLRMKSLSCIAPGVWSRLSQEIVLKKQLFCVKSRRGHWSFRPRFTPYFRVIYCASNVIFLVLLAINQNKHASYITFLGAKWLEGEMTSESNPRGSRRCGWYCNNPGIRTCIFPS